MTLEEQEASKYRRMWAVPAYRVHSPGLNAAPTAYAALGMGAGDSLADYGCGECKAMDWFAERGLDVTGFDIVPLRPDVNEACLWRLPSGATDWAFCCDVMEHIPPDRVDAVLQGIAGRTRKAAFFGIATQPDRMGRRIGETLHLTVEGVGFWRDRVARHFGLADVLEESPAWVSIIAS